MFEFLQVTAEYSNAVLVAIMPYISDFARNLDLPIPQPITPAHVRFFGCSYRSDHIGGRVVLTNDYEFSFDRGRVVLFRSPNCYFHLQDVNRIPEFYGKVKVTQKEAVQVACEAIKKLGYTEAVLHADRPPRVTPPPRSGANVVTRYRIEWLDPEQDPQDRGILRRTVEFEVDAVTKQIHMMGLMSKATVRPDPVIGVRAPVMAKGPQSQPVGGRRIHPVSATYSNSFLLAILPQVSEYLKKAGFETRIPISTNDVDMGRFECGLVDNDPNAFFYLKTGERIVYSHGQVICFEAADAVRLPENKEHPPNTAYGPVNMTADEAVSLARKAVTQLGYSIKELGLDRPPKIAKPWNYKTNFLARYFLNWIRRDGEVPVYLAVAEVDATTKKLKALYINDHANTNIWRAPPKIDVPMTLETNTPPKQASEAVNWRNQQRLV